MEPIPPRQVRFSRRAMLSGMAMAALAPAGCLNSGKWFTKKEEPKPVAQGRLLSTWDHKVTFAPDVSKGGSVYPGLVGRIYLFGPDMVVPYLGDGEMIIDLYDSTPRGPGSEPKWTDRFVIDPPSLKQFAKKDFMGDGYTIFFPWFNYKPEVTDIYLRLHYVSAKGENFFHQSGTFPVDHTETRERQRKGQNLGGSAS